LLLESPGASQRPDEPTLDPYLFQNVSTQARPDGRGKREQTRETSSVDRPFLEAVVMVKNT
jgi:hypothetical protein